MSGFGYMHFLSRGHLYVVISHATALNEIMVLFPNNNVDSKTNNIAYHEVLLE